ncbi:MAG: hypothetical protein AB2L24_21725 [Mangrovibacterium sp.]
MKKRAFVAFSHKNFLKITTGDSLVNALYIAALKGRQFASAIAEVAIELEDFQNAQRSGQELIRHVLSHSHKKP